MGWLAGWQHRKTVTITGQSGAGTDYQVDFSIGDASGGDFHLENHCTSFPNDIQVTDNDQTTLLDHWVEDLTVDPITMWVEVADDLGSNVDICVYYDKLGESSASNGANTFIQYHGSATSQFLDTAIALPTDYIVEIYGGPTADTQSMDWGLSNSPIRGTVPDAGDYTAIETYSSGNARYGLTLNEGTMSSINEAPSFTNGVKYKMKIVALGGTSHTYYVDNDQISTLITTNLPDENMGLCMWVSIGTAMQNWSFIRKYASPEPAFSTVGSEESAPGVGACSQILNPWGINKYGAVIG